MSRISRLSIIFAGFSLIALAGPVACERVPLLAPTGTVINLTLASDVAALNSSVDVIAVLIENGGSSGTGTATTSSTTGAGTPVQNGTTVSFTTTIGTIEPSEAKTQNGRVNVKLITNGQSGKATVTAFSGGAKSTAQITIGAAAVDHLIVTATPANLSSNGGTTTVSARAEDISGNGQAGVQVQFTTTKGTLSAAAVTTDSNGVATTKLTTTSAADVTAAVGGKNAKVTIGVASKATLTIANTGTNTAMSTPITFTVTPGTGTGAVPVSNVVVDYGDNNTYSMGSPSSATPVQHFYSSTGIFNVSVTGTDPDGIAVSSQLQIAITGISVTLTSSGTVSTSPVVFTATVTPSAAVIDHYDWDIDNDGVYDYSTDGNQFSYTYPTAGRKTITVRAVPKYGSSHPATATIQITLT